jgi:DNA-binding MarR family transcriptional regulator
MSDAPKVATTAGQNQINERVIADLLSYVDSEAHISQRQLAVNLGVALGLVNTYVKRCVKKGLIKVRQVPSRRYAYYLTPQGFAEKSRLTAQYLTWSLSFFRSARAESAVLLREAQQRKWSRIGLYGASDLTEIVILSAAEQGVPIAAVVDAGVLRHEIVGVPVFHGLDAIPDPPDGWIVTNISEPQAACDAIVATVGVDRVLVPPMLSVRPKAAHGSGG